MRWGMGRRRRRRGGTKENDAGSQKKKEVEEASYVLGELGPHYYLYQLPQFLPHLLCHGRNSKLVPESTTATERASCILPSLPHAVTGQMVLSLAFYDSRSNFYPEHDAASCTVHIDRYQLWFNEAPIPSFHPGIPLFP